MALAEAGRTMQAARAVIRRAGEAFAAERERWPLWVPVGIGAGTGGYFALPFEPAAAAGWAPLAAATVLGLVGGRRLRRTGTGTGLVIAAFVVGAPALGFAAAKLASDGVAAPRLERRMGPVTVSGRILAVEPGLEGPRVTLGEPVIGRLAPEDRPRRVRLRVRTGDVGDFDVGAGLGLRAVLLPPPGPAVPGGYDFARDLWFKEIGAVGFAVGAPRRTEGGESVSRASTTGLLASLRNAIGGLRRVLFDRITAALPGTAGGIAAALMTGERGHIPEATMEAMRAAGLAHLLAISGLHIGLVTGILFFGVRALLALWPWAALNWPIKKWAAGAALLGAFAYMLLTGATVPTQRAFLMAALVLGAVILDRNALSMRLVAFAAVVVLLIAPEAVTGPSFQMSFAAVAALIAAYEVARVPLRRLRGEGGVGRRVLVYLLCVLLTTLIAGLATAPFALYHFNRFAAYGLAANLGAVPITAIWIMPLATLAYLLMPLGLEGLALDPMGWGLDAVIAIAGRIAAAPGASVYVPTMPLWGLLLIVGGGLWLVLWRRSWRLAGAGAIAAGLLSLWAAPPPDLLVSGDGRSFAVRVAGGRLSFGGAGGSEFQKSIWLRRAGLGGDPPGRRSALGRGGRTGPGDDTVNCDSLGCIAHIRGFEVSLIADPGAAREDCARAHLVVALVPLTRIRCRGPRRVISRWDLWREGAHAIWIGPEGRVRVETVAESRGRRPWAGASRGQR